MANSLLEGEPPPPPNPWPKRILLALLLLLVVGGLLYWQFRYYRYEQVVHRFFAALQAGDFQQAYQIWNPTPAYTFEDFMEDWGPTTPTGRVREYEILNISPPPRELGVRGGPTIVVEGRSTGVIVTVLVNGHARERLWVETNPPRLSFPPF